MSATPTDPSGGAPRYEIRLQGHLDPRWAAWFDGLSLTNDSDGTTALRGPVVDQSALHGVLHRVRDTGLRLISVSQLDPDQPPAPGNPPRSPRRTTT